MPACFIPALTGIQTIPPDHAVVPPTNSVFSISRTLNPSAGRDRGSRHSTGARADDDDIVSVGSRH